MICKTPGCNLETKPDKPYCHGHHVVEFITQYCTHIKGKWAGKRFELIPWQYSAIMKFFGTLKPDGTRQYRTLYLEVPKKNGKSELASAIALYLLVADGEQGAEVYSAGGDVKQASLVFNPASQMVLNDDVLSSRLAVYESRLKMADYSTGSTYEVLSSEVATKHGLNPSGVVFDELHAQKTRDLYDVLTEGTDIAREQQAFIIITTAGVYDKHAIGWEIHNYACQVRDGIIDDPTFLPIIYGLSKEATESSKKLWANVNPSLGYIFDIDSLQTHYNQTKHNPTRLNNFKRYRLNMWTNQVDMYLSMPEWDDCNGAFNASDLVGAECYAGLDLSSTLDLTCFCLLFPPTKQRNKYLVLPHFYVPSENMSERARVDKVPYDIWTQSGLINATPGNVVDYAFIKRDVKKAFTKYNLREVAYDPWGAVQLATELDNEDGIPMVEFRQGFKSMSPPTKELLKLTKSKMIEHNGHPVLRWCADNLVVKTDPAENVKPDKKEAKERIDGIVALVMALGRAMVHIDTTSIYESRGVIVL